MHPNNPIPTNPADRLLTKKEAAAYLRIAPRTLDDVRQRQGVACIVRPGYVRFLKTDLDAYLARHRIEARTATKFRPRRKKAANLTTGEAQP